MDTASIDKGAASEPSQATASALTQSNSQSEPQPNSQLHSQANIQPAMQAPSTPTAPALKHSGLGIAAFILSILSTLLIFALVTIAGVLEATTPGGIDETSLEAIIVGMLIFAFIGLALVGLGLGIGGLVQKQRKKIFAILGTIFSSVTILATLALIAYGTTID